MNYFSFLRNFTIVTALVVLLTVLNAQASCASEVARTWLKATAKITDSKGQSVGSGFFVSRTYGNETRTFLVTNKHVLAPTPEERKSAAVICITLNSKGKEGQVSAKTVFVTVCSVLEKMWREHPDPQVDVLAVDVTELMRTNTDIDYMAAAAYGDFVTEADITKYDITPGTDVCIIGYPIGLTAAITAYSFVRQGLLASRIEEPISGSAGTTLPAFFIDSQAGPGSSGSPVVLKPAPYFNLNDKAMHLQSSPVLLGIVSSGPIGVAPVPPALIPTVKSEKFPFLPGMIIVFRAETIRETIELFFKR